jgi:hypothetical protein
VPFREFWNTVVSDINHVLSKLASLFTKRGELGKNMEPHTYDVVRFVGVVKLRRSS